MEINAHTSVDSLVTKIRNLSTTNADIADIIKHTFDSDSSSPQEQQLIVNALSTRSQSAQALSNAYRVLFDGISAIIRNMRP